MSYSPMIVSSVRHLSFAPFYSNYLFTLQRISMRGMIDIFVQILSILIVINQKSFVILFIRFIHVYCVI